MLCAVLFFGPALGRVLKNEDFEAWKLRGQREGTVYEKESVGCHPRENKFMWGTATAAYQVEGAVEEDGRTPTIWDTFSHIPGKTVNGDTGDNATNSYHMWETDLQLMKKM